MDRYPTPLYPSGEEYDAAALMLGMIYDRNDHTFQCVNGTLCYCPDTLELVYDTSFDIASGWHRQWEKRKSHVLRGVLGPRAHPDFKKVTMEGNI